MTLQEAIVAIIESRQGCKATELAPVLADLYPEVIKELDKVAEVLDDLMRKGELVEVEYILPSMEYRVKSFLLPKGTKVL